MNNSQDILTQLCCINCQTISENPLVTSCCNSVVCTGCQKLVQNNTCPACKANNYQILYNSFLSKLSSQVSISCKYQCGHQDSLKLMKEHEQSCPLRHFSCTLCNFSSAQDEFLCHLNIQHSQQMMETFSKGGKKENEQMDIDPTKPKINRMYNTSTVGETSKYYCGKDIGFKCGCCNGCGPTNGDNCLACMILDVRTRNLPKGYLVNKHGANAILKGEVFACGRQFSNRKFCGLNFVQCDGCQSLTRNKKNYFEAYNQ